MRSIILDLETLPNADASQWVDPITKAPSNYKKQESIDAYLAEANAEQFDKFGLDPDTCTIAAIGFHVVGHSEPTVHVCSNTFEEREGLKMLWNVYTQRPSRFITFNGSGFDLPVLVARSILLDVEYPTSFVFTPAWKSPHLDLYEWKKQMGGGRAKSLAFYARQYGFTTLDKVRGSEIAQLAKEGRWQEIHDHCLSDVGLTHALANRWKQLPMAVAA
jgi:uncharacterized protein YprB with RNaseH-like and TPR domain